MLRTAFVAAIAIAAASVAPQADAKEIVTGGSATVEVTYPLLDLALWGTAANGSPPAQINGDGNPVLELPAQATRDGRDGPWTGGSQVVEGGYDFTFNGGLYLFPLSDATDPTSELESFDDDGNRLCCRNALTRLSLNTATGEMTGIINNVFDRPSDLLFTLGETTDAGTELLVSDNLAELLSFAYSDNNPFFPLFAEWDFEGEFPDLAGQSVGLLNYTVDTELAPVPVPAALPLLAAGLGLMGLAGARRKRA